MIHLTARTTILLIVSVVTFVLTAAVVAHWLDMAGGFEGEMPIGERVSVGPSGLQCELRSAKKVYKVGDELELSVRLTNRSGRPIVLPRPLRSPQPFPRYPRVDVRRWGPLGGLTSSGGSGGGYCGNCSLMEEIEFVQVAPGQAIDPLASDRRYERWRQPLQGLRAAKAGSYSITFCYSTDCDDLRFWVPPPPPEREAFRSLLQRVPAVRIEESVSFEVVE